MAIIKSYTDIEQSRKLAEILPLESSDMYYNLGESNIPNFIYGSHSDFRCYLPCWSLAALLNVLPSATLDSSNDHYYRLYCMERFTEWYDNVVDACYKMIIKLNELKML